MLKRLGRWLDGWKYALAVVAILGSATYVSRQYQRAAEQCDGKGAKPAAGADSTTQRADDINACANQVIRNFPRWYRLVDWPEGIGAWAILLTLLALAEQTLATRKAAEAARDSISLQEANLRQWVAVEFIRSKHDGVLFDSSGQMAQQTSVEIRLQVANPTPPPLTIKKIITEVSGAFEKSGPDYRRFTVEVTETLIPRREGKNGGYPFYVALTLDGEEVRLYQADRFTIALSTTVFYESAARKMEEQSFESVVQCGAFKDLILEYRGKPPQQEAEA